MMMYVSAGIRTSDPSLSWNSNHSTIGTDNNLILKLMQYFLFDTILQEFCVVCKGYIEN